MKTAASHVREVKISELVLDKRVQLRASLNRNAILDYAQAMEFGDHFPPIVVFFRAGGKKYVADGFHRVLACKKLGRTKIVTQIHDGGRREAILFAAKANTQHGVRRTNEDKRKAAITLLKDPEWRKWTDTEIARACAVSPNTVAKYREWLQPEGKSTAEEVRTYIDRSGRERTRTVPRPAEDVDMEEKITGRKCPYCGHPMWGKGA